MASRLDRLLESIHPAHVLDEVDKRADDAINGFPLRSGLVTDWGRFRACLIDFMKHVECHLLRLRKTVGMDMDFDWGRCTQILMRLYGANGEKAAFEMARTGNDGGLFAVLRRMARNMAEDCATNEIRAKVLGYWHGLSVDQQLAAAEEYLAKYGHLLPSELTEGSAGRVRANLPKVLREHPRMMQRLGRIGRT